MGKWNGKSCRLIAMLSLTFSFFLVEIIVGYVTGSLALVADSFHMLSDVVALIVGLLSVRYSKRGSSKNNTFGWARAEVLGAMVNAVFLVALCFTIFVEAIQRMIETEAITQPVMLLITGGLGLLINVIGLLLFHNQSHGHSHGGGGHGHSHGGGGHGHSHGGKGHGHSHGSKKNKHKEVSEVKPLTDVETGNGSSPLDALDSDSEIHLGPVQQRDGSIKNITHTKDPKQASAAQLNMHGVFLHVLGDALGSVVVVISAVIYLTVPKHCPDGQVSVLPTNASNISMTTLEPESRCMVELEAPSWVGYVDPVLSLILVFIILSTSLPLIKDSGRILMQTVPTHIVVSKMQRELEQMDGVLAIHEFHVWSLAGDKIVASLHLHLRSLDDYVRVSNEVKEYFHDEGIHSVTIQPEFLDLHMKKAGRECVLECGPEKDCHQATCCEVKTKGNTANASAANYPTSKPTTAKPMENTDHSIESVTVQRATDSTTTSET